MAVTEIIGAVKDVLLGGAAVTTAVVAVKGLMGWRRELKGKAEFDAARGLAKATYKLRDTFYACRAPFIGAYEFPEGYQGALGRPAAEEEAKAWGHVYKNRWAPVGSALQEFDACALEAESIWGPAIRQKTDAIRQCLRELNAAMQASLMDKAAGGEDFRADKDFGRQIRSALSSTGSDDKDDLTRKMQAAVAGVEDLVRPHLRHG